MSVLSEELQVKMGLDASGVEAGVEKAKASVGQLRRLEAATARESARLEESRLTLTDKRKRAVDALAAAQKAVGQFQGVDTEEARLAVAKARLEIVRQTAAIERMDNIAAKASAAKQASAKPGGASALLGLVPGLGAFTSVAGATAAIKSLVSYGGEIRDTSENIGVSVEFLQRFRTAASLAGVGTETATKALAVFNQTLGSAIDGEEKAELKFAKLGISLRDSSGQARSTEAVMLDVADAIKNAGSDAQRSAIAFELFGKKGLKMVGALKGGAEEMANQMAKVSIVSEAQIESLDKLGDKATEVFRAWKAGMAGGFADVFSGPAVKGLEALSVFNDKASTMIGAIGAALMTSWEEGQSPLEIYNELLAEAQNRVEVLGSEMRRNLAQKDAILSEKTLQKLNEARDILMDIQMESAAPNVRAADFSKQIEVRFNKAGLLEFEAAQAEAEGKLELAAQKNIEAAKERTEIEKLKIGRAHV